MRNKMKQYEFLFISSLIEINTEYQDLTNIIQEEQFFQSKQKFNDKV
ncbi:hypothetical protein pb186bvf_003678 [Paramecium bursaria]